MKHPFHLIILLFAFAINAILCNYLNVVDLIPNRGYRLHWKMIDNSESVQFKVEVKTRGYFALGVSKSGGMSNGDLVTGYVHANGSAILHDRFSKEQGKMPEIVEKPNWQLISGRRNETHLTFEFKRKCGIEDDKYDVPISKGMTQIIYATGKVDPHDRTRGSQSRNLISKLVFNRYFVIRHTAGPGILTQDAYKTTAGVGVTESFNYRRVPKD